MNSSLLSSLMICSLIGIVWVPTYADTSIEQRMVPADDLGIPHAEIAARSGPAPTTLKEIEPWGQDVDGDGIATSAEGEFDFDGDGEFSHVEALWLGLDTYVRWMPRAEFVLHEQRGDLEALMFGRVCASACLSQGGGYVCTGNLDSVNCIDNGGICQSVPCGYPCHRPPPGGGGIAGD